MNLARGNTELVVGYIADAVGADLFEVVTAKPRFRNGLSRRYNNRMVKLQAVLPRCCYTLSMCIKINIYGGNAHENLS